MWHTHTTLGLPVFLLLLDRKCQGSTPISNPPGPPSSHIPLSPPPPKKKHTHTHTHTHTRHNPKQPWEKRQNGEKARLDVVRRIKLTTNSFCCCLIVLYLTQSIVILLRRRVIVGKHQPVGQSKVLQPQIGVRHPVLPRKQSEEWEN